MEASITVRVTTNRQPRQLIARALNYHAHTLAIAQQVRQSVNTSFNTERFI